MANKVLTKFTSNNNTYVAHNNITYSGTSKTLYSNTSGTIDLAGTNGIFPAISSDTNGKVLGNNGSALTWVTAGGGGSTYTASKGITIVSDDIQHTNSVTAQTSSALTSIKYDAYGHITAGTSKVVGRGIDDQSNVIGHSNAAITANTTNALKSFTVDTYGHVTGYTALGTVGSTTNPVYLNSGTITASDVHIARQNSTEGSGKGEQVSLTFAPSKHTTASHFVPTFNWLGHWDGRYGTTTAENASNLQFGKYGYLVGTGWSSTTVGSGVNPVYVNAGTITASTSTVGSATEPVYLNGGTLSKCSLVIPKDQIVSSSTYYPVYMANDTTAGSISYINMPSQTVWSFNPSTKKWKYTTTDGTQLDFGLTKVTSW